LRTGDGTVASWQPTRQRVQRYAWIERIIYAGPNWRAAALFASQPYASDARPRLATAGAHTV